MKRSEVSEAYCGDICVVSGISDITIGETICSEGYPVQLPSIKIEEPTMSMNFIVNTSLRGQRREYVTTRKKNVKNNDVRLMRATDSTDASWFGRENLPLMWIKAGEGSYDHLSQNRKLFQKNAEGKTEPVEEVVIEDRNNI